MLHKLPPKAINFIPWFFVLLGFIMVWAGSVRNREATERNRQLGLVNQAYNRASNCFAATSPTKRTPDHVKECYRLAEEATGVKIERYGDGK